jgi:hypothetical protein
VAHPDWLEIYIGLVRWKTVDITDKILRYKSLENFDDFIKMFGGEDYISWGVRQAPLEKKRGRAWSMRLVFLCFILWLVSSASFGGLIALWGVSNGKST